MVVCSIRLRISWAVVIGKVLLQLMDARTFVRTQVGIKAGYTEDVRSPGEVEYLLIIGRNRRPVKCGPCADAVVMAVPGALVRNLLWGLDAERPAFFQEVRYLGYNIAWSS